MPQTWMITGANRGIGLAMATALATRGEHVVAAARVPDSEGLAALVAQYPGQITPLALDVTSDASVAGAKTALGDHAIDVLVNNAGAMAARGADATFAMDFDAWRSVFEVNVYAPLRVAQAFLPNVEAGQGRKIATISSRMGSIGSNPAGSLVYRSSKAAVNMTMVVFGEAVKARGIACLLFHPGWVQTDMGGSGADITPQQSAAGLIATIDASGMAQTNSFRNWDGQPIPW